MFYLNWARFPYNLEKSPVKRRFFGKACLYKIMYIEIASNYNKFVG